MEIPGYTIQRQIGRGGMARVYLATQQSLNRPVVLKVLDAIAAEDGEGPAHRFLSEGRIIAALNHPNIITIYDIGIADDMLYISMEYLQGGDLKQRLKQPLPPALALDYLEQIADALGTAHQHGIIHRDVKPANILFKDDDTPVLTDFGIAKRMGADKDLTMTGMFMGSPNYVSPEQADGIRLDSRSDIYSLGCIFYEMLTGSKPFRAATVIDVVIQHKTAPIPLLPDGLKAYQPILNQMLAKERQDRFPDVASLITEIQKLKHTRKSQRSFPDFNITGLLPDAVSQERRRRGKQILFSLILLAMVLFSSLKYIEIRIRDSSLELDKITTDTVLPETQLNINVNPVLAAEGVPHAGISSEGGGSAPLNDGGTPVGEEILNALRFLGRQSLEDYKLTYPPKDNAYYYYSRLLELEPGSQSAVNGILQIAERYAILAERALANNEYKKTMAYVDIGLRINPENKSLLSLKSLAEERNLSLLDAFKKMFSDK